MRLTDIAINNLRVRKTKMLFLGLGMVIGIGTIVALFTITTAMRQQVKERFEAIGARVVLAPDTRTLSLSYNGITVASGVSSRSEELPDAAIKAVDSLAFRDQISIVSPKLLVITSVASRQFLVAGVHLPEEFRLHGYWSIRGNQPAGPGEVLLGALAATAAGKQPGDRIELNGRTFKVAGVLAETGGPEDRLIFADLSEVRATFNRPQGFSFIELVIPRDGIRQADQGVLLPVETVLEQIREKIPGAKVSAVKDEGQARREVVDRFARFSILISLVVIGIGVLIIGTTMMSSVNERTGEIGIFRAIGFRQGHIMRIILTEAAIVSAVGGFAGYLAGMGTAMVAAPVFAEMQVGIRWSPLLAVSVILLSIAVGFSASLYPAIRASRLDPAEALRLL